jgi:broad specificity phosphatase PhoE
VTPDVRRSRRRFFVLLVALCAVSACGSPPRAASETPAPLRIYLARHGETDWNVIGRMQGQIDVPLNATGREQALLLRDTMKDIRIDAVYSSTLSRSRDTALAFGSSAPLISLDGLREQHRGKFQGKQNDDPEYLKRSTDPDDSLDGGESLNQLTERVRTTLARIKEEHPSGNVVIVGHTVTNQMILRVLLNLPVEQAIKINQGNEELYLIELEPGVMPRVWKLIRGKNIGDL